MRTVLREIQHVLSEMERLGCYPDRCFLGCHRRDEQLHRRSMVDRVFFPQQLYAYADRRFFHMFLTRHSQAAIFVFFHESEETSL